LLDVTAYDTAYTMAVQGLHAHIGNAAGRIAAYGYGDGSTVHCTENFAMSYGEADINEISSYWNDPDHRLPATYAYYKHVGAGVASYNGVYYYVLHACYTSAGTYTPGSGTNTTTTATSIVSQIIVPVVTATPQADGSVMHIVQSGQSLWAIATAYGTKIDTIKQLNSLTSDSIYNGDELIIYPAGSMPTPLPTATLTPTSAPTRTPTLVPTAADLPTPTSQVAPTQAETGGNSIPMQTIAGYAIVLVSVIGLLAMLVKLSIKKIK
ncbi:MAG: LysM peptidoglycan-binding domain-containing protein, partial [Anaerolineaceae bacterium]